MFPRLCLLSFFLDSPGVASWNHRRIFWRRSFRWSGRYHPIRFRDSPTSRASQIGDKFPMPGRKRRLTVYLLCFRTFWRNIATNFSKLNFPCMPSRTLSLMILLTGLSAGKSSWLLEEEVVLEAEDMKIYPSLRKGCFWSKRLRDLENWPRGTREPSGQQPSPNLCRVWREGKMKWTFISSPRYSPP